VVGWRACVWEAGGPLVWFAGTIVSMVRASYVDGDGEEGSMVIELWDLEGVRGVLEDS